MKLSKWRPAFITWLAKYVKIDKWLLDAPSAEVTWDTSKPWQFSGNTVGYLPPLRSVDYTTVDPKTIKGRGIQELFVLARFDRNYKFDQLPVEKIEGLHCTLCLAATLVWQSILPDEPRGLTDVTTAATEYPVTFRPAGDRNSDWVCEIHWQFIIEWLADAEEGLVTQPFEITAVGGRVLRSKLYDFQDNVVDFTGLFAPRGE